MPCSSPVSKRLDEPLKHNIIDKRPSSRRSRLFSASASASDRFTGLANSADSGLPARPRLIQFRRLPSETPNRFAAAPTPTDSANRIASLNSSVYFRYICLRSSKDAISSLMYVKPGQGQWAAILRFRVSNLRCRIRPISKFPSPEPLIPVGENRRLAKLRGLLIGEGPSKEVSILP